MKNAIYYFSKANKDTNKEYAKNIAFAISNGSHIPAYPIEEHTILSDINILFIGCDVAGGGKTSGPIRRVLKPLTSNDVKLAVVFSVIKGGDASALAEIKSLLEPKGIKVCDEEFVCKGASAFSNKGCPTEQDVQKAREFGATILSKYK